MTDPHRIDGHKLHYHPGRVARRIAAGGDWELAKSIYPIYVELSPTDACNHACVFCGLDFARGRGRRIEPELLAARLDEMAALGVKSVMFAGEGEPLLYKPLPAILERCAAAGIDAALTTNLVPLVPEHAEVLVRRCRWIKVSINGGDAATYAAVHGTKPEDFDRALANMARLVDAKARGGHGCTLGAQLVLLPDNARSAVALARTVRDLGFEYLVIKPHSQHPSSATTAFRGLDYAALPDLAAELDALATDRFRVVHRHRAAEVPGDRAARYPTCLSTPFFWAYVDSGGGVWGCSCYLGRDDGFRYGNLHEASFREIWEGERRRENLRFVLEDLDASTCRALCRMDACNRHLWDLTHPGPHVNFI